jgi:hypothetical protein
MRIKQRLMIWGILILLFMGIPVSFAQIIENPAKPLAANAGRVVTPKEVLSIEDTGEKFYFKYPHNLKVGPDGSIFAMDIDQLLQFDATGKFQRNRFRKGQGPGEMTRMNNYAFEGDGVVAFCDQPPKLVWTGKSGQFEKSVSLPAANGFLSFYGQVAGRWTFSTFELPRQGGEPVFVDVPNQILTWKEGGKDWIPLSSFPVKNYFVPPGASIGMGYLIVAPFGERFLAISHASEYAIHILDVASNAIVRSFRRNYARVAPQPKKPGQTRGRIIMGDKVFEAPEPKYENDIFNILSSGDRFWVVTSTVVKAKGIVIDVFDQGGIFQDSFYLNLSEAGLNAVRYSGGSVLARKSLYTAERTDEGTFAIKKYRIAE